MKGQNNGFIYTPIKLFDNGTCCDSNTYYTDATEVFPAEYIDYIKATYGPDITYKGSENLNAIQN